MKTIIHVNQHRIRSNIGLAPADHAPVLTVKTYKNNKYGKTVTLRDSDGNVVGRFVYRPDKPLSCGARLWFETDRLTVEVE